jgi:hypothetical protein
VQGYIDISIEMAVGHGVSLASGQLKTAVFGDYRMYLSFGVGDRWRFGHDRESFVIMDSATKRSTGGCPMLCRVSVVLTASTGVFIPIHNKNDFARLLF